MPEPQPNCLFICPPFTAHSFWNFRHTCQLAGAVYPEPPLGLITVAALLPSNWNVRLVDCNIEELTETDLEWADLFFSGGMIAQQAAHVQLVEQLRPYKKPHIVGGPDATSSPHLYSKADHLVLGEAEVTLPAFIADYCTGAAKPIYKPAEDTSNYTNSQLADMTASPTPRFDLLKLDKYLYVNIQHARGCPFRCEFCDIIELFGRVPRVKTDEQILGELEELYQLGYRGRVDFSDDNFIGNKKLVKKLLPKLRLWLEERDWPFEFFTEATLNMADDDELLGLMQEVGFSGVFIGIETPEEETLLGTQKSQNTRRSIPDNINKLYQYGMLVSAGYIVGFDGEKSGVASAILNNIEECAIPVSMIGLLSALPQTQLTKRLRLEGRIGENFEIWENESADQCLGGLNFETLRPREEILDDYCQIVREAYLPKTYYQRVKRMVLRLNCSKKRLKLSRSYFWRELSAVGRIIVHLGLLSADRRHFWSALLSALVQDPKAIRYCIGMLALYSHFGPFSQHVVAMHRSRRVDAKGVGYNPKDNTPVQMAQ